MLREIEGLLPLRPRPVPDELLSSWLMRLAFENAERVSRLTYLLTGTHSPWFGDLDRKASPLLLNSLASATGIAVDKLEDLTLRAYHSKIFAQRQPRGYWRWVRTLGIGRGSNKLAGLMYCPLCLNEQAYLRRAWRFGFVVACSHHKRLLLERCPHCNTAFLPHRNEVGKGKDWSGQTELSFAYCHTCGEDLRHCATYQADAEELVLALQGRLLQAATDGQLSWGAMQVPSLEGFEVLHQLLTVIANTPKVQDYLRQIGPPYPSQTISRGHTFEQLPVLQRYALLRQAAWLITDWPERFDTVCYKSRTFKFALMSNFSRPPKWFAETAEQLNQTSHPRQPKKPIQLHPALTLDQVREHIKLSSKRTERERWQILEALLSSSTPLSVYGLAQKVGCSSHKVHLVIQRYQAEGIAGLKDKRQRYGLPT